MNKNIVSNIIGSQLPEYVGYEAFLSFGHNDHSWETIRSAVVSGDRIEVVLGCNIAFFANSAEKFQVRQAVFKKLNVQPADSAKVAPRDSDRQFLRASRQEQIPQPLYPLSDVYSDSLAGLTDEYQLAMAYVHWLKGTGNKEGVFHYYFRELPFKGGYAMSCGLSHLIDYLTHYRWSERMLAKVAAAVGNDGKPLYQSGFVDYLRNLRLTVDVDAVREGSVIFANQPIIRVRGSIIQGHLLESALLNLNNFLTLCATKSSRIVYSANGKPVSDQSLRRDQGVDGSLAACWATSVGGFSSTSNYYASEMFGIPSKGTMAHALIMAFVDELDAMFTYADALPNNCVFLVDTYDSIEGIKKAIKVGHKLRQGGNEMIGIRLDSGDLAYLSKEARRLLDEAGFSNAKVFVSNDLDEHIIKSLNGQGARIDVYGVGTKVGTCFDQPALGGVYKLGMMRDDSSSEWVPRIKLSEQMIKVSTPGMLNTRRFYDASGKMIADMIFDEMDVPKHTFVMVDQLNDTRERRFAKENYDHFEDQLVAVMRAGRVVYHNPSLPEIQAFGKTQLASLDDSHKRLDNPHEYPVGLSKKTHLLKKRLIKQARRRKA
jgi:nicotinate phosphoribosyltransferase